MIFKLPSVSELRAKLLKLGIGVPDADSADIRVGVYGDSAELSHELLKLIRHGHKRAGTSLLWDLGHRGERVGQVGTVEIVVDHRGEPSVVTRDLSVTVMPFAEVGAEYAALEAEGDLSLRYWRTAHWAYFSRVCARIGRTPTEAMPVVCNVFEVLHVVPGGPDRSAHKSALPPPTGQQRYKSWRSRHRPDRGDASPVF